MVVFLGVLLVCSLVALGWNVVSHGAALSKAKVALAAAEARIATVEKSVSISGLVPPYGQATNAKPAAPAQKT